MQRNSSYNQLMSKQTRQPSNNSRKSPLKQSASQPTLGPRGMGDAKRTKYNPYKDHFKQPVAETQPEEKEKSLNEYLGTHNE